MYLPAGSSADVTISLVGSPTSVSFKVYSHLGILLNSETVVPTAGATELTYVVAPAYNTVSTTPGWERRSVRWTYVVNGRTIIGSRNYKLEAGVFLDADEDLVRSLLGVDDSDLEDDKIDLVSAFFQFRSKVDPVAMDLALIGNDSQPLIIARAIAALAALDHVEAMALQVALKESSGSNSYERGAVDWAGIQASLMLLVDAGYTILANGQYFLPTLFDVGTRTDAITGA